MTPQQASELVTWLRAAFPRQKFAPENVAVYTQFLCDLDYEATRRVVRLICIEQEWFPSIAQIRQAVAEEAVGLPSPDRAWEMVCLRWGERKGTGDKSVELPIEVRNALDIAGVDPHRYWTADDRTWLRRAFFDTYQPMLRRLVRAASLGIAPQRAALLIDSTKEIPMREAPQLGRSDD